MCMTIEIMPADKFQKPVSALAMVPKTGVITRVGRQAYTVMMIYAREQGAEDLKTGLFSAPLNSIIRGFGGSKGTLEELKKHLRSMVTHVVEWQSPTPAETEEWGACGLLSQVSLKKKNGENWLSWAYPPALRQELMSPSRYAQIRRSTIAQFRTHAGLALYEICARYKDNPSHKTSKQHWHWWLPVLTGKPSPKEIKTEFRFFNRDTLKPAIEEVNEVSEMTISVYEFKEGRSIEFIQFEVHLKPEVQIKETKAINLTKVAKAHQLGIEPEVAEDLFIRYGELAFGRAVARLEARLALPGTPILSRPAYLKSLLAERVIDTSTSHLVDDVKKLVVAPLVVNSSDQRQVKMQQRESERVKAVRSEIEDLPTAEIEQLLRELKQHFQDLNMSPAIMKRLERGDWQSALIMGVLIRFYWRKTRGTDWSAGETMPTVEQVKQAGLF